MITKVTKLQGIGTLHAPLTSGPLLLKKKTIIFGENGRGKTTFVAVHRSLATGDVVPLRQRMSIKGTNPQVAQVLIGQDPHDLSNGKWNKPHPQISFFDAAFIEENVYTGTTVIADHRKNLLSFALGEEGVKFANRVDKLAGKITTSRNFEIQKRADVQPFIKNAMTPEVFLKLDPPGENAPSELEGKRRTLDALLRASTLAQLQTLSPISFEEVTAVRLSEVLGGGLDSISRDAETKMKNHLRATHATEEWISKGTDFDSGDRCPYCAQDLRNSEIAPIYPVYFSAAYREYKEGLVSAIEASQASYSAQKQASIRSTVDGNRSRLLQWKEFLPEARIDFDLKSVTDGIESARAALQAVARRKLADPLEKIAPTTEENEKLNAISSIVTIIDDYNAAIVGINSAIQELRNCAQTGNADEAKAEVSNLENRIARHSASAKSACEAWRDAIAAREALETEKAKAKNELDKYTSAFLLKYKDAINQHLKACGTSFKISTLRTAYQGGTARCEYGIELLGVPVDLANKPSSPITFESAMSQGDKSALAFAFFLARLESDPTRSSRIVIFDDPLSSLDGRRRRYTRKKIAELSNQVAQTIVLSHEEATVADIARRLGESECSLFELRQQGDYSSFAPTTLKEITANEYAKCFEILSQFLSGNGRAEEVVKAVRPFLEMNLRLRFPDEFNGDSLGKMIGKIRSAEKSLALARLTPLLSDLDEINEYCTQHSHGDGALVNKERMLDSDLRAFVEKAIQISRGIPSQDGK